MTELLCEPVEVRTGPDGAPLAIRLAGRWRPVTRTVNRWLVETDWWRAPARRDYRRCLTADGECLEIYLDLESGKWWLSRRYD